MRAGLNMKRGPAQRTAPVEAADAIPVGQDIDVELFRQRYRAPFEQALRDAMKQLDPHEVTLLQLHFVNGTGLAEIGALYGVHKSTISRQLARARGILLKAVRERMQADMACAPVKCTVSRAPCGATWTSASRRCWAQRSECSACKDASSSWRARTPAAALACKRT